VQQVLGPTLQPGQSVVRDHRAVHQADSIRQAIEARGGELLCLPPYAPDFTPIEPAFSQINAILRGLGARARDALVEAIRLAVDASTRDDAVAWFAHAGYPLPDQGN
jgi:transposase